MPRDISARGTEPNARERRPMRAVAQESGNLLGLGIVMSLGAGRFARCLCPPFRVVVRVTGCGAGEVSLVIG